MAAVPSLIRAKIADGAVTTAKIADDAVVESKIQAGAVKSAKIADSAVTTAKIADGTITNADVASDATIAWGKISKTGSNLTDLATRNHNDLQTIGADDHHSKFTSSDHADIAHTTEMIQNGAVIGAKIANNTIKATHMGTKAYSVVEERYCPDVEGGGDEKYYVKRTETTLRGSSKHKLVLLQVKWYILKKTDPHHYDGWKATYHVEGQSETTFDIFEGMLAYPDAHHMRTKDVVVSAPVGKSIKIRTYSKTGDSNATKCGIKKPQEGHIMYDAISEYVNV